jgi:hypothetical protein
MITIEEGIRSNKNNCYVCKKLFLVGDFIPSIQMLKRSLAEITTTKTKYGGLCEIYFCETCWKAIAGEEYTFSSDVGYF